MDTITRLARSHMARAYGLMVGALVLLIWGDSIHSTGLMGIGALVAFAAGAEFNGEVLCSQCATSLDSEELPDGTEPDSGEHGFKLPGRSADEPGERWYDEPNRTRLMYPEDTTGR